MPGHSNRELRLAGTGNAPFRKQGDHRLEGGDFSGRNRESLSLRTSPIFNPLRSLSPTINGCNSTPHSRVGKAENAQGAGNGRQQITAIAAHWLTGSIRQLRTAAVSYPSRLRGGWRALARRVGLPDYGQSGRYRTTYPHPAALRAPTLPGLRAIGMPHIPRWRRAIPLPGGERSPSRGAGGRRVRGLAHRRKILLWYFFCGGYLQSMTWSPLTRLAPQARAGLSPPGRGIGAPDRAMCESDSQRRGGMAHCLRQGLNGP